MKYNADIKKLERKYLPQNLEINSFSNIESFFTELFNRPLQSKVDVEQWLLDASELEAAISEDACWRQIKMTCDTTNPELEASFSDFVLNIQPQITVWADKLNRKLMESPFTEELDKKEYFTYLRNIKKRIELFNEENIPLQSQIAILQQQYGQIAGGMTVDIDGKTYTLQQAAKFLESSDRSIRENVYKKIQQRRLESKAELNKLFDQLLALRNQVAQNAGFESYTDYRFKELGRFDYTPKESTLFHEAVKQHIVPLVKKIYEHKKQKLGVDELKPWDIDAEPAGTTPLKPFTNAADLLVKTKACFSSLNPFFADCIEKMDTLGHFDLDSRQGKAPGGYNCPLAESGAPFIFMNAAGKMDDVTTMVHEGGHAVHSFLSHPLKLSGFKEYPMEIAELASMSMELFSMDYWDSFFSNEGDLRRAKAHQLERAITIFPWIAIIDKLQFWLYANPIHTVEEREAAWQAISNEFSEGVIDYAGLENFRANGWQKQLHLFEVPFYYIEYGIAQLGAIAMWQQFVSNKEQALENYMQALSLGGTQILPELYKAAGIEFNFSSPYVKQIMNFVEEQLNHYL